METWNNYRHKLAKDIFKVLSSNKFKHGFSLQNDVREEFKIIGKSFSKTIEWYQDFDAWQIVQYIEKLAFAATELLKEVNFAKNVEESRRAIQTIDKNLKYNRDTKEAEKLFYFRDVFEAWSRAVPALQSRLNCLKDLLETNETVEAIKAANEIKQLFSEINSGRQLYAKLMKDKDEAKNYSDIFVPVIFAKPIKFYLESIPQYYKEFRLQRQKESKWYQFDIKNTDIYPLELDLVLLNILSFCKRHRIGKYRQSCGHYSLLIAVVVNRPLGS